MSLIVRPWATQQDLRDVWHLFKDKNDTSRRKACDIVQVWKSRSAGKMPHQIMSTAALVDAQLTDISVSKRASSISSQTVSAAYAMAILSFVTGTADIQQTKEYKMSMFDIAKDIELPIQLVEIRHVIVHEGVPSLTLLRQATKDALDWLAKEYWKPVVEDRGPG